MRLPPSLSFVPQQGAGQRAAARTGRPALAWSHFRLSLAGSGGLLAGLLVAFAAAAAPLQAGRLEGLVNLDAPFPLPPEAVLDVQLLELPRSDAPAVLRGRSRSSPAGRAPYPFVLTWVPGSVVAGHRYQLRATIHQADRLLFKGSLVLPFPEAASPGPLPLRLDSMGSAPLRGLQWLTAPAAGVPAPPEAPRQEQQFRLDPFSSELTGSGDCNRFIGSFQLQGEALRLEPGAGTRLECEPSVIADEQAFLERLMRVRRWRLDGQGRLQLLDEAQQPLLLMETRPR